MARAELIDVARNGRFTTHKYYVRLLVANPRMAFLLRGSWLAREDADAVTRCLATHNVTTFSEELST